MKKTIYISINSLILSLITIYCLTVNKQVVIFSLSLRIAIGLIFFLLFTPLKFNKSEIKYTINFFVLYLNIAVFEYVTPTPLFLFWLLIVVIQIVCLIHEATSIHSLNDLILLFSSEKKKFNESKNIKKKKELLKLKKKRDKKYGNK
ncbi:hypothetical protein [Lactococcus petauri]|uniref:hypothetical protein n=1 Tax=Lactococcus petauri TaxID=1940789 RepID=UPI00254BBE26|nr:hypothetical protein [Lactococcus petauri]